MLQQEVMMLFLRQARSDDSHELVGHACRIFDQYQVNDYMTTYEDAFESDPELSDSERVDHLLRATKELVSDILQQQGVYLDASLGLRQAVVLLQATHDIVDYEDHDRLMMICDLPTEPLQIYAEIVSLVSDLKIEHVMGYVERVSEDTALRIKEQLIYIRTVHEHDDKAQQKAVRYHTWRTACGAQAGLFSDQYTDTLATIDLPFKGYLAAYREAHPLEPEPSAEQLKSLGYQLFGMAILSCDAGVNILQSLSQTATAVYPDLKYSTPLYQFIQTLFMEYSRL
jgi:hypothetical protein